MTNNNDIFSYGKDHLTAGTALRITHQKHIRALLEADTLERVAASRQAVEEIVAGSSTVYGINTGFGPLCTTKISETETKKLQDNILRSHSVGVGEIVQEPVARLMLILKIHALARGYSGIAPETLNRMIWHVENRITPAIPSQGSVGASGDLAPLSHLFLPLIGQGSVYYKGAIVPAARMFQAEQLTPLQLGPKEGLALINGTQFMAAHGVWALERLHNCLDTADVIGAMTLESLLGSARPFLEELHDLRPFSGNRYVARRIAAFLDKSEMVASHANCGRVQDPYSLRCMPQVHGASRTAWLHLKEILEIEINAVTDNPVIFNAGHTVSGGNFHGQPIALPMDYAAVAASELGNISDRRTYLLLEGGHGGLPKLLMRDTGINSGFMIPQYTSAALVSENKSLCFPASADSIPTSLGQEDHVSMGAISARKLNRIIDNLENILAVELVCAAQAFDFRRPMKSGPILEACHGLIRERIDHAEEDRIFSDDLAAARELIVSRKLNTEVNDTAAHLNIDPGGDLRQLFDLD